MRYVASADVLAGGPGLLALDSGALEKVHIRTITLIYDEAGVEFAEPCSAGTASCPVTPST